MKHLALLLCVLGFAVAALPPIQFDSDIAPVQYEPAELCQPWICRAPACKCASTESGGNFPVEKTPQV